MTLAENARSCWCDSAPDGLAHDGEAGDEQREVERTPEREALGDGVRDHAVSG